MDSNELDNYRFSSEIEPTEVMLSSILEEAVDEANAKMEKSMKEYFANILQQAKCVKDDKHVTADIVDVKVSSCSSSQPFLIVVAGPNGSGKTTFTSQMLHHHWLDDAVYINPDIVAQDKFGDWNSPEAVLKAARYCVTLREKCLSNHTSLVVETVLSTPRNVGFIERARAEGYYVSLFFIATSDPTINAARVARRVMEGGHDVPISKIISRYPKSILNCRRLCTIVDQLYVIDNSRDGERAQILFHKHNGVLMKKYMEKIPLWARPIL